MNPEDLLRQLSPGLKQDFRNVLQHFPKEVLSGDVLFSENNPDDLLLLDLLGVPFCSSLRLTSIWACFFIRVDQCNDLSPAQFQQFCEIMASHSTELIRLLEYRQSLPPSLSPADAKALIAEFNLRYRLGS